MKAKGMKICVFITHGLPLMKAMHKCPYYDEPIYKASGRRVPVGEDSWHFIYSSSDSRLLAWFVENLLVIDKFVLDGPPCYIHSTDMISKRVEKLEFASVMKNLVRAQLPDTRSSTANAHWHRLPSLEKLPDAQAAFR